MNTQDDANQLLNSLNTQPTKINILVNKLSLLKNNFNKKYVISGIIVIVAVVGVILYLQYKKNKNFFGNKTKTTPKPTQKSNPKPVLEDDDEEPQQLVKKSKPTKQLSKEEPKHLKELDLTNEEIKVIEDELNNQSTIEDNLSIDNE